MPWLLWQTLRYESKYETNLEMYKLSPSDKRLSSIKRVSSSSCYFKVTNNKAVKYYKNNLAKTYKLMLYRYERKRLF